MVVVTYGKYWQWVPIWEMGPDGQRYRKGWECEVYNLAIRHNLDLLRKLRCK